MRKMLILSVVLTILVTIFVVVGQAEADQCPLSRESDCGSSDGFRSGVSAARQDLFLDFNLGFWFGPISFAPDLLTSLCREEDNLSDGRSELPWWRTEQISYDSPRYQQNFKRGYWQQTRGGNNKMIAKLAGWGSSLAVIFTGWIICCGGG